MTPNLYFAYSIKEDYDRQARPEPVEPPPKERKKKTRACDACAVRKTKCDESRPCRHCVYNNIECTELRQRKKSGPKNLRQKTIDSINSISKDASISPDKELSATSSVAAISLPPLLPDLKPVVHALSALPPHIYRATVPFAVPSMVQDGPVLISGLLESQGVEMHYASPKHYAVTTLALVMLQVLSVADDPLQVVSLTVIMQQHVAHASEKCRQNLLFLLSANNNDFDTHYYLALAELHLFSYLMMSNCTNNHKLVHLRSAITHYQLLEVRYGKDNNSLLPELRRTLFLWERHAHLFDLDPTFRRCGLLLPPSSRLVQDMSSTNVVLDSFYLMLCVLDELMVFQEMVPDPLSWLYQPEPAAIDLPYNDIKLKLLHCFNMSGETTTEYALLELLRIGLLVKVLELYAKDLGQMAAIEELLSLVVQANAILGGNDENLKIPIEQFALNTHLLELLKGTLEVTSGEHMDPRAIEALLQLSGYISLYMSNKSDFLMKDATISDWFSRFLGRSTWDAC